MCDKVWKDYRERGVYNQGWIDPAGDMFGGGEEMAAGGGRLCRTSCSQEGARIPMPFCAAPPCFPRLCCGILLHAIIAFSTFPWLWDGLYPQSPRFMGITSSHLCLSQGLNLFKVRKHG